MAGRQSPLYRGIEVSETGTVVPEKKTGKPNRSPFWLEHVSLPVYKGGRHAGGPGLPQLRL